MNDQYLYRYFDENGALLYNGRSNDWTRRLREHWRDDSWSSDIMNVTVERYPNLVSVVAAEVASIRAEHPRYNLQHNRPGTAAANLGAGGGWTTEDIILMIGLVVLLGCVVYKGTVIAVGRYRCWKAERDEFRTWKQARAEVVAEEPGTSAECASVPVGERVAAMPEPETGIIPKPLTHAPAMNLPVAVALAVMLCGKPWPVEGSTIPLAPADPPTARWVKDHCGTQSLMREDGSTR